LKKSKKQAGFGKPTCHENLRAVSENERKSDECLHVERERESRGLDQLCGLKLGIIVGAFRVVVYASGNRIEPEVRHKSTDSGEPGGETVLSVCIESCGESGDCGVVRIVVRRVIFSLDFEFDHSVAFVNAEDTETCTQGQLQRTRKQVKLVGKSNMGRQCVEEQIARMELVLGILRLLRILQTVLHIGA